MRLRIVFFAPFKYRGSKYAEAFVVSRSNEEWTFNPMRNFKLT